MRRRASQLLAYPRDRNPYQESLYEELRPLGVDRRYVGELTRSHTLNLVLLPFELAALRIAGHRCLHLHWTFGFTLPGERRYPSLRLVMRWYFVALLELCRLGGIRVVWTAHNVLPHDRVFDDDERARQQLMARCTGVIAHHRSTLARLAELGCLLPASAVIPPGPAKLAAQAGGGSRRGRHGRLQVVFVGNLAPYKGVEDLLEVLAGAGAPSRMTLVVAGECRDAGLAGAPRRGCGPGPCPRRAQAGAPGRRGPRRAAVLRRRGGAALPLRDERQQRRARAERRLPGGHPRPAGARRHPHHLRVALRPQRRGAGARPPACGGLLGRPAGVHVRGRSRPRRDVVVGRRGGGHEGVPRRGRRRARSPSGRRRASPRRAGCRGTRRRGAPAARAGAAGRRAGGPRADPLRL